MTMVAHSLPRRPLRPAEIEKLSDHARILWAAPYYGVPRRDEVYIFILSTEQRLCALGYDDPADEWRLIAESDGSCGHDRAAAIERAITDWTPPDSQGQEWGDQSVADLVSAIAPAQSRSSGSRLAATPAPDSNSNSNEREPVTSSPDADRRMTCLRCGNTFVESAIVHEERWGSTHWWCPTETCAGAGIGFDLHPAADLDESIFGPNRT